MTYQEQIKHPKWQKKRLEVLEANNFTCQQCGRTDMELHVHHTMYKKGASAWEYEISELKCYYKDCHKVDHDISALISKLLAGMSLESKSRVLGYADSFYSESFSCNGPNYQIGFMDGLRSDNTRLQAIIEKVRL